MHGSSGGELTGDYSEDEFDEFVESAVAAESDLESFSFEMDMQMAGDQQSVGMTATGNADLANEQMKMDFSMSGAAVVPGAPSSFVMYIDGDDAFFDLDDEWLRMPAEQDGTAFWDVDDELAVVEAQYEYGDVHVEERDDVVVVTTELDGDAMDDYLDAVEEHDPSMADAQSADWSDVEILEIFDADTYQMTESRMTAEMTERGETFDYEYELSIDDVNEDLETAVPDEAREEAEEASGAGV